ncbi:hypothetical protein H0A36_00865 [Endozoicomonas sp. SM1973]|uniref:Transmembrane protein n=1 Tax=Spartinivicinus marinus TaxID=2994442 RepID=A0A853I4L8_9GAMM|nr:hypothetical protein [Spartinivicinus marinus]MCX4026703.1 hypothetical protein [Spartinivicinus marinus]NYZ64537.1 hypothetical protein [Spartinivicinus marinus]
MNKQAKAKLFLTVILGLPIIGIVTAYASYYSGFFSNIGKTNNGKLISPPVTMQDLKLDILKSNKNNRIKGAAEQTWKLIILTVNDCNELCQQQLYITRQVHIALGKEANRLERLYLSTKSDQFAESILEEHPKLKLANISQVEITQHLSDKLPTVKSTILLADPLGNIMMYYTDNHSGKAILTDIKHLLKISRIG